MSWLFSGTTQIVSMDDHTALTFPDGAVTKSSIGGWFKLVSNAGTSGQYFCSWNTYAPNPSFNFLIYEDNHSVSAKKLEGTPVGPGGNGIILTSATTPDTAWHHLMFNKQATGGDKIYLDGVEIGTQSAIEPGVINSSAQWHFGNRSDLIRDLNGRLAEWAKWDRELTGTEITNLAGGTFPETLTSQLKWHCKMYNAFTEDHGGLVVTNSGASVDAATHPLARAGGSFTRIVGRRQALVGRGGLVG